IDSQSLPSWMVQQGESPAAPVPSKGQTFSASSLLDIDSLPSWMRESDAERGTASATTYGDVQGQAQQGGAVPQLQQWQQQAQLPLAMQTPTGSPVNQIAGN